MEDLDVNKPFQVVASDMTAFWVNDTYYELTLYMDLFNNEIVSYRLSSVRGDRNTYINELEKLMQKKKNIKTLKQFCIQTKDQYILQKVTMNFYLYIISHIQCLVLELQQIMQLWKQ